MVKSLTVRADTPFTLTNVASSARYGSFAGGDDRTAGSTVAEHYMRAPVAGVLSHMAFRVTSNARSTATAFASYINGGVGNQSISVPGGATGWFEDTSNSDTVAALALFCWRALASTGSGTVAASVAQIMFEATTGSKQMWGAAGPGFYNQTATTTYYGFSGGYSAVNESQVQLRTPDAGVLSNMAVYCQANTLTLSATAYRVRINGANGNGVVTVPAGATGWFEDTSNTDTVAKGDLVNWSKTAQGTGTGNATVNLQQILWSPSSGRMLLGGASGLNRSVTAASTEYFNPWGFKPKSATLAAVQSRLPYACTTSNFRIRIPSGTFTTASATFRVFKNGSAGNQNITVPTGANGTFEDTSNTDSFAAGDDIAVEVVNSGISGTLYLSEMALDQFVGIDISPAAGVLTLTGLTPTVVNTVEVAPAAGVLTLTGFAPTLDETFRARPAAAALGLTGLTPTVLLSGQRVSQGAVLALAVAPSALRASQGGVLALGEIVPAERASQGAVLVLAEIIPSLRVSQSAVLVLADAVPCHTRRTQCWIITRPDGQVLGFTAHDEPIQFLGVTCSPCNSLAPSATEGATEIGAVGNMELTGIISSDAISEFDLYAGKFDGADVDVWDVPWGAGNAETARRLAAGRMGAVSHGRDGFSAEVLGIGAQAQQQALTQVITPACRFVFGDDRCTVNKAALTVTGTVGAALGGLDRRTFADPALSGSPGFAASYFVNGVVTFTSGENVGLRSEVKEYDSTTGTFVLWRRMPKPIGVGDTFTAAPGCDLSPDNCKRFSNYLNFGGFPDLPGDDALAQTPNAKY